MCHFFHKITAMPEANRPGPILGTRSHFSLSHVFIYFRADTTRLCLFPRFYFFFSFSLDISFCTLY